MLLYPNRTFRVAGFLIAAHISAFSAHAQFGSYFLEHLPEIHNDYDRPLPPNGEEWLNQFGVRVRRVSDIHECIAKWGTHALPVPTDNDRPTSPSVDASIRLGFRHGYSLYTNIDATGNYMFINHNSGYRGVVYDLNSYEPIYCTSATSLGGIWIDTESHRLRMAKDVTDIYFLHGDDEFLKIRRRGLFQSGKGEVVADMRAFFPGATTVYKHFHDDHLNFDGRYWPMRLDVDGEAVTIIVDTEDGSFMQMDNWQQPYVMNNWGNSWGTFFNYDTGERRVVKAWDRDGNFTTPVSMNGHIGFVWNNGNHGWVFLNNHRELLNVYYPETDTGHTLLYQKAFDYGQYHLADMPPELDGWVLMSTSGPWSHFLRRYVGPKTQLQNLIFLVQLNPHDAGTKIIPISPTYSVDESYEMPLWLDTAGRIVIKENGFPRREDPVEAYGQEVQASCRVVDDRVYVVWTSNWYATDNLEVYMADFPLRQIQQAVVAGAGEWESYE